jgi:hypothetical protein
VEEPQSLVGVVSTRLGLDAVVGGHGWIRHLLHLKGYRCVLY